MRLGQFKLLEVYKQVFQACVFLFRLAEVGAVEADVAEDAAAVLAAHLLAVGVFKLGQRHVDKLADVVVGAVAEQIVERTLLGHHETLVPHGAGGALPVALILLKMLGILGFVDIADVLQEEHSQDVVLILARVNESAERVAGFPYNPVYLCLVDFWCFHYFMLFCSSVTVAI